MNPSVAIMVLGSFRSGTSSLAAALVNLGVYFGEENALYGANEHNPAGHYELIPLQMLHNDAFDAFGMKYYSGGILPDNWQELPGTDILLLSIKRTINQHFRGRSLFGWKDPSGSALVPLYKEALRDEPIDLRYAICVRHPLSVIASMRKRSGTPEKRSPGNRPEDHSRIDVRMMGVWVYYTLASLRDTVGQRKQIFCYERFMDNPAQYLKRLEALVGVEASDKQAESVLASIRPQWSHTRFEAEDLEGWPEIVRQTFALCMRADEDTEGFSKGQFDEEIEILWRKFTDERNLFNPSLPLGSDLKITWTSSGKSHEKVFPLGFENAWREFQIEFPSGPSAPIHVQLGRPPNSVWIRKSEWHQEATRTRAKIRAGQEARIKQIYGMPLVDVLGPNAFTIEPPPQQGPVRLELEVLLQSGRDVLVHMIRELGQEQDRT